MMHARCDYDNKKQKKHNEKKTWSHHPVVWKTRRSVLTWQHSHLVFSTVIDWPLWTEIMLMFSNVWIKWHLPERVKLICHIIIIVWIWAKYPAWASAVIFFLNFTAVKITAVFSCLFSLGKLCDNLALYLEPSPLRLVVLLPFFFLCLPVFYLSQISLALAAVQKCP